MVGTIILLNLFNSYYISIIYRYTPQSIELENKLKPFIPDFIPAVGDIDAFVKVSSVSSFQTQNTKKKL